MRSIRITTGFLLLLIAAFLALAWRCFYLQHYKNDLYNERCIRQQHSISPRKPRRGTILDRRLRVLAASDIEPIIKVEPRIVKNPEDLAMKLAPIVEMDPHVIYTLIMESKEPGYAKIRVGGDAEMYMAARKIYGVGVDFEWLRYHPMGRLTSNVVGFTRKNGRVGLDGLELAYDRQLTGSSAEYIYYADIARRRIGYWGKKGVLSHGAGIILTLDATIQQFVRDELLKQYEKYQAESAFAIVVQPKTGAILAMVSLPDFDPLETGSTDPNFFKMHAVQDSFEPGSVIKPIVMAIGLDAGVIKKGQTIFCENGIYAGKGFGRITEYKRGFGNLTPREILIKSSNIGMAKIGQMLGPKRLYKGLRLFGFGKKTKIELPHEESGTLWPVSAWTTYSETRIPFGQEVCVTGVQLVRAFCILANEGRFVRLHIVKAIVESDGTLKKLKQQPPPVGYIVKPEIAKWVIGDAMAAVVNEGTGKRAKLDKWQVFGKTGTANIALEGRPGYSKDDYIASFVSGAPAEDPEIVVLISIRKPNKKLGIGYTGGVVASPAAAGIIEKTLNYLEKLKS